MFKKLKNIFKKAQLPIGDLITAFKGGSDVFYSEMEEKLILSDVSIQTTEKILEQVKQEVRKNIITNQNDFRDLLKSTIMSLFPETVYPDISLKPLVILVAGINGAGKTTSIAKLSEYYRNMGLSKILLSAADTFRAAADEQLKLWAEKTNADIYISEMQRDPAAVAYVSYEKAINEHYDLLIIDTAGRMHNNTNLMKEISKIDAVLRGKFTGINLFSLLVIDSTNGSNALVQAKQFSDTINTDAVFLSKFDGTAKGGALISIVDALHLPIIFAGTGEDKSDIWEFSADEFTDNIILKS